MLATGLPGDGYVVKGQYQISGPNGAPITVTRKAQPEINPKVDDFDAKYAQIAARLAPRVTVPPTDGDKEEAKEEKVQGDPVMDLIAKVDKATAAQALDEVQAEIDRRTAGEASTTSTGTRSWWDLLGITWLTAMLSNLSNYSLETLEATRAALIKKVYG